MQATHACNRLEYRREVINTKNVLRSAIAHAIGMGAVGITYAAR